MADMLGGLKNLYFSLEDRYYEVLDQLQPRVPVYSLVDPVDKILPSFGIILAAVLALLVLFGFSALSGLGGGGVALTLTFHDESSAPLSGVSVSLSSEDHTFSHDTGADGQVVFQVPPGAYTLTAEKEGYSPFSQSLEVDHESSSIFTLQLAEPPVHTRTLVIQDSTHTILGLASPLSILLTFSCQAGTPPANQTVANGNVSVVQPVDCLGLSVNVSAPGYVSKTQAILGDTTVIELQDSAAFQGPPVDPTTGTVEVYAKDGSSAGIPGMQVKLYKVPAAGSNILSNQSLSDESGFVLFQDVTPGRYVVIASKSGYKQSTTSEFQVDAGATKTINVSVTPSSSDRKIFVKILSSLNQLPISGAVVALHVQSVSGKYLEYESYTTDTNGIIDQPLADFNGATIIVVKAPNFVAKFTPNAGVVSADEDAPLPILLDPATAPAANGSISNAVIADARVVDSLNLPISLASVNLYYPDANGVRVDTLSSNASGVARFVNLPAGTYQATASTSVADGVSPRVNGSLGQIISLPITMDVGNALVEVTVKDEHHHLVPDANVSIVNASSSQVVALGVTNAQGVVQLGVATGQQVFVRVTKTNYLPFSSVPFTVIKDNTHHISIEVGLTADTQGVEMSLIRIDELSSTNGPVLAQSLVPGNTYAFHFSVRSPTLQSAWKALARVNPDSPSDEQTTDVGSILDAQSALGGVAFYTTHNPIDPFSPSGLVGSGTPAKVSIASLGDVNGGGSFEYIVVIKINPAAIPNVDHLELRYQSKSSTQLSPAYQESYTIGQALPAQGDFSFVFFLTEQGQTQQTQVSSSLPAIIEANKSYSLTYVMTNLSGADFPTAGISFNTTTPSSFTITPTQATLPGFLNNASVSGSVTIRSTSTCAGSTAYCSSMNVLLSGVGSGHSPTNYTLNFFTIPEKQLSLQTTPAFLIPGLSQVVQAVATDNQGNPLTPAQNVQIQGQLEDSANAPIGSPILFTGNPFGVFLAAIPAASEGDKLVVTASAAGYLSDTKTIPITTDFSLNFSQDFSCLTFSPGSVSFQKGAVGVLNVQTQNCLEPVSLYTSGFSENGQIIELTVKNGTAIITPSAPLLLNATDAKTLNILSPAYIGQYPLYVWAKYASESAYVLVKNVDVTVNPLGGSTQCLNISKYAFDLSDGSDAASIVNACNPAVHDPFLPSVQIPTNGVYAHAIPPLLTPEMRFPGNPVAFNWTIRVDYNGSNNLDVNHADFSYAPAVSDGNWFRYQVDPASFVPERSFFVSDAPDLVVDQANLEIAGGSFYTTAVKSLLFESTFISVNAQTLYQLCMETTGVDAAFLKWDGQTLQSGTGVKCAANLYVSPGPHAVQVFVNDTTPGAYSVKVYYRKTNSSSPPLPLHTGNGLGFSLSPYYGLPASNDLVGNGVVARTFQGTVIPSTDAATPKYLATLPPELRTILLNTGGIDHLKQAYVQALSDNPQVRVFLKDADVYAQFIGADDPNGPQSLFVENLGMSGEKYGVLTLHDYVTPAGGTPALDVGVLVDSSSSLWAQEQVNTLPPGTISYPYQQDGVCRALSELEREIEYTSGVSVNFRLFLMGNSPGFHKTTLPNLPCASLNPTVLPMTSNPPGFDPVMDNKNEAWAYGAQLLASDSFWQAPNRVMVIVTDNKPYGTGNGAFENAWKGSQEEALVNSAAAALNANNIRAIGWYKTPFESSSVAGYGDTSANDAIEMLDLVASQTNGFVEAMDFPEFVPASATSGQHPFALSSNNAFSERVLQHAFDIREEHIVVKLNANPASACVSDSGAVGQTGVSALPKILLNWTWASISPDTCDQKAPPNETNFRFCDATQFTVELSQKLRQLELDYATNATPAMRAQIPFLMNFDTYLIRDTLNDDFRSDFKEFFVNSSFADAPSYFKNSVTGAWKDYIDPGFGNLDVTIDGQPASNHTLPSSGLYRVEITISWDSDEGVFFVASSPSAHIHVKLTRLADARNLTGYSAFYELPLDGLVGVDESTHTMNRDGYGTAFTGSVVDLVQIPNMYTVRSYPSQSGVIALNTLDVGSGTSFVSLNTQNRGELVNLDLSAGRLALKPSLPAPVIAEWSSDSFGDGDVFYGIQETDSQSGQTGFISYNANGNPSLARWVPIGSVVKQPVYGCTSGACAICLDAGGHSYLQSGVGDYNPVAGSCTLRPPLTSDKAFGFTSTSGLQNSAYLGTVLYRVPQNNYSILLGCNDSPTHHIGQILTGSGILASGNGSVGVLDSGSSTLEATLAPAQTLFGMLDLIGSQWTCVSTQSGKASVYWNAQKLRDFLVNQNPGFGNLTGNACVATGNPAGPTAFWNLEESVQPLGLTPSNASAYCPLFNASSVQGYYHQSGLPYPVGTQINIGNAIGPVTGDAINVNVQYRYAPTGCSKTQNGFPSCPGQGSYNYCASNTQRIWVGIPNIQP